MAVQHQINHIWSILSVSCPLMSSNTTLQRRRVNTNYRQSHDGLTLAWQNRWILLAGQAQKQVQSKAFVHVRFISVCTWAYTDSIIQKSDINYYLGSVLLYIWANTRVWNSISALWKNVYRWWDEHRSSVNQVMMMMTVLTGTIKYANP